MPSSGAARRWGARRVVLAVSAATASAVAAAAVAAAKIPFPSPTAARLGYLHRLPAMQCDTATPMAANGSRGLLIERAGGRAFFPLGPQTCAPPLRTWGPRVSAAAVEIEDGKAVVNLGSQSGFRARLARMIRKQSQDGHLRDLVYLPLAKEGDGEQDRGLYQAAAVAEVLSMRRNSYAGAMHRATGDFDVLAVSRLTVGYFLDDLLLGAVDVIGTSRRDVRVPMLTLRQPDGVQQVVPMWAGDVLTLGRAGLADPRWWTNSTAWPMAAYAYLRTSFFPNGSLPDLPSVWSGPVKYWEPRNPGGESPAGDWTQALSFLLCQQPASSFVSDAAGLCAAPTSRVSSAPAGTVNAEAVVPHFRAASLQHMADWRFSHGTDGSSMPPPCNASLNNLRQYRFLVPQWVAGTAAREINPASADEESLALAPVNL